jgi:hypothetical protein
VKWTVQTPILTCDLSAPGDWFAIHTKILEVMGIKDQGPVTSEAHAQMIGDAAKAKALAKRRARSGAATQ